MQPLGRRIGDPRLTIAVGLAAAALGLVTGIVLDSTDRAWLVVPAAMLLGAAYGLILVGGLATVESLAHPGDLGALNAIFYSLTYTGFAAPLLSTLALNAMSPASLMTIGVVILALTVPFVLASAARRPD